MMMASARSSMLPPDGKKREPVQVPRGESAPRGTCTEGPQEKRGMTFSANRWSGLWSYATPGM